MKTVCLLGSPIARGDYLFNVDVLKAVGLHNEFEILCHYLASLRLKFAVIFFKLFGEVVDLLGSGMRQFQKRFFIFGLLAFNSLAEGEQDRLDLVHEKIGKVPVPVHACQKIVLVNLWIGERQG